ncbi:hypothetical protein B7C42_07857 [Nocardia cerradoensis]|uniref:Uncharacterized protein n=2 Tax=Nocardia cerradoensis TaxID=85688 RepID=A0A231GTV0_9NOCA|nr:hypothetical protein B7C42_07857 [Nocardia cerradoensis]
MSGGADDAGEDMVVGRTNSSQERTLLVAEAGDPDGYQADYVLQVATTDNSILTKDGTGVDAVQAIGTEPLATGGAMGTIPAGNGVVGRGLNGLVGYVHTAVRDKKEEGSAAAGVLGEGGSGSPGVFGRGVNGVVGYTAGLPRDTKFEADGPAGVVGVAAGIGVRGKGDSGGVFGQGTQAAAGVTGSSELGSGVVGFGDAGVMGISSDGFGVMGVSDSGIGGVFDSAGSAQVRLIPRTVEVSDPNGNIAGQAGDLLVLQFQREQQIATLWFCSRTGDLATATWVQVA